MRVAIQSALQIAAAIFSTSAIAAEISSNELPTGDVWPSQATPHGSSHAGKEEGTPAIPPPRSSPASLSISEARAGARKPPVADA